MQVLGLAERRFQLWYGAPAVITDLGCISMGLLAGFTKLLATCFSWHGHGSSAVVSAVWLMRMGTLAATLMAIALLSRRQYTLLRGPISVLQRVLYITALGFKSQSGSWWYRPYIWHHRLFFVHLACVFARIPLKWYIIGAPMTACAAAIMDYAKADAECQQQLLPCVTKAAVQLLTHPLQLICSALTSPSSIATYLGDIILPGLLAAYVEQQARRAWLSQQRSSNSSREPGSHSRRRAASLTAAPRSASPAHVAAEQSRSYSRLASKRVSPPGTPPQSAESHIPLAAVHNMLSSLHQNQTDSGVSSSSSSITRCRHHCTNSSSSSTSAYAGYGSSSSNGSGSDNEGPGLPSAASTGHASSHPASTVHNGTYQPPFTMQPTAPNSTSAATGGPTPVSALSGSLSLGLQGLQQLEHLIGSSVVAELEGVVAQAASARPIAAAAGAAAAAVEATAEDTALSLAVDAEGSTAVTAAAVAAQAYQGLCRVDTASVKVAAAHEDISTLGPLLESSLATALAKTAGRHSLNGSCSSNTYRDQVISSVVSFAGCVQMLGYLVRPDQRKLFGGRTAAGESVAQTDVSSTECGDGTAAEQWYATDIAACLLATVQDALVQHAVPARQQLPPITAVFGGEAVAMSVWSSISHVVTAVKKISGAGTAVGSSLVAASSAMTAQAAASQSSSGAAWRMQVEPPILTAGLASLVVVHLQAAHQAAAGVANAAGACSGRLLMSQSGELLADHQVQLGRSGSCRVLLPALPAGVLHVSLLAACGPLQQQLQPLAKQTLMVLSAAAAQEWLTLANQQHKQQAGKGTSQAALVTEHGLHSLAVDIAYLLGSKPAGKSTTVGSSTTHLVAAAAASTNSGAAASLCTLKAAVLQHVVKYLVLHGCWQTLQFILGELLATAAVNRGTAENPHTSAPCAIQGNHQQPPDTATAGPPLTGSAAAAAANVATSTPIPSQGAVVTVAVAQLTAALAAGWGRDPQPKARCKHIVDAGCPTCISQQSGSALLLITRYFMLTSVGLGMMAAWERIVQPTILMLLVPAVLVPSHKALVLALSRRMLA